MPPTCRDTHSAVCRVRMPGQYCVPGQDVPQPSRPGMAPPPQVPGQDVCRAGSGCVPGRVRMCRQGRVRMCRQGRVRMCAGPGQDVPTGPGQDVCRAGSGCAAAVCRRWGGDACRVLISAVYGHGSASSRCAVTCGTRGDPGCAGRAGRWRCVAARVDAARASKSRGGRAPLPAGSDAARARGCRHGSEGVQARERGCAGTGARAVCCGRRGGGAA